jgi:hypothetical protein
MFLRLCVFVSNRCHFEEVMLSQSSRIILDTLVPAGAHPALKIGILDAGFDEFWTEVERTALPGWRWGLRAALFAANWISPLLIRSLPPLAMHTRSTRVRALAAMETSRVSLLRQIMVLLKTIVSFCYGADPNVRTAVGYPRQFDDSHANLAK